MSRSRAFKPPGEGVGKTKPSGIGTVDVPDPAIVEIVVIVVLVVYVAVVVMKSVSATTTVEV